MTGRQLERWVEGVALALLLGSLIWVIWSLGEPEGPTHGEVVAKVYHLERAVTGKALIGGRFEQVVEYYPRRWELVLVADGGRGRGRCRVSEATWNRVQVGAAVVCEELNRVSKKAVGAAVVGAE